MARKHHQHVTKHHEEHSGEHRGETEAQIEAEEEAASTGMWKSSTMTWLVVLVIVAFILLLLAWQFHPWTLIR